MDTDVELTGPAEAAWLVSHRKWTQGWRSLVFPGFLLVYLLYVVDAVSEFSHGAAAVGGQVILAAFAVCWLLILLPIAEQAPWRFWTLYGVMTALFVAELPFAHAAGFVLALFITMITVSRIGAGPRRSSSPWRWRRRWSRSPSGRGTTASAARSTRSRRLRSRSSES